jgi:hypothetical protein
MQVIFLRYLATFNLSYLYVCTNKTIICIIAMETPRQFITAVINLRGVSTNKTIITYNLFYK